MIHTAEEARTASAGVIIRNDPARVLREVEAKRRILARHSGDHHCPTPADPDWIVYEAGEPVRRTFPCGDLRDLASVYSDRPGYQAEWTSATRG